MGRSVEANEQMKETRRALILSCALRLFASNGLAATKISHIAKAAGMSQGLLYHYYQSKEQIYVELIRHAFERMNMAAQGLETLNLSPIEKIKLAIEELFAGFEKNENTALYHLLIAQAAASEAIPNEAKSIIQRESKIPYEIMSRIIAEGQIKGEISSDFSSDELSLVFWTTIKGLALHKGTHGARVKLPDSRIMIKIFLNYEE